VSRVRDRVPVRSLAEEQAALRRVATLVAEGATAAEVFEAVRQLPEHERSAMTLFYIGGYLLPHRQAAWTLIAERLRQAAGLARRLEGEGLALKGVIAALEKYATQLEASS